MITKLLCIGAVCSLINGHLENVSVKAQRNALPFSQELLLSEECEKMNSVGEIRTILEELAQYSNELVNLNLIINPNQNLTRILELRTLIRERIRLAKSILKEEWTTGKWMSEINWTLNVEQVVKAKPAILLNFVKLRDFQLSGLELGGIERSDLYPLIDVREGNISSEIKVKLMKNSSSLELCQFFSSLTVTGDLLFSIDGDEARAQVKLSLRPGAKQEDNLPPVRPIVPLPRFDLGDDRCRILRDCDIDIDDIIKPKLPIPYPITPIDSLDPRGDYL